MFARKPAICKTDELSCSINDGIINAKSDSHSGEGCRTFIDSILNQNRCYMASGNEQEFSGQKDTPCLDGAIHLLQGLYQSVLPLHGGTWVVRREYVEDMSRSQHQQHLDSILRVNRENSEEKLLKKNNGLSKLFGYSEGFGVIFWEHKTCDYIDNEINAFTKHKVFVRGNLNTKPQRHEEK